MINDNIEKIRRMLKSMRGHDEFNDLIEEFQNKIETAYNRIREEDRKNPDFKRTNAEIESMFDEAIANEEFRVFYQPKVNLKNYMPNGAEALCRWYHEDQLIYPDTFIPVLERSSRISRLDFYMLEHVCKDIRSWLDQGKEVLQISVNLSRKNVGTENLVQEIVATIDKYKVPHSLIQIELTESAGDLERDELKDLVLGLRDQGISTAVDDFGTGFSSLKLISELPWNVLKIDRSLLHEATREGSSEHLMFSHIISMVRDLGMECVVEGVETAEDIKLLKDNNCYVAQGYYFDKPINRDSFEQKLNVRKRRIKNK